jgi:RNA polymerase sigma factor (sigma-70 family)
MFPGYPRKIRRLSEKGFRDFGHGNLEMIDLMDSRHDTRSLAERAREGDREAFQELAQACRERLARLVRFRLGPALRREADVDDVLQETHLRAFRGIEGFRWRSEDSFFQWLSGIARCVILEHCRKVRAARVEEGDPEPEVEHVSPSRALRRDERFDRLQGAVNGLTADYRRVLCGVLVEKLPLAEIARRMGRTPNAVSLILLRANRKLREAVGDTQSLGLPAAELNWGEKDDGRA